MMALWRRASMGIGLLLVALGVILTDRRSDVDLTPGGLPTAHPR